MEASSDRDVAVRGRRRRAPRGATRARPYLWAYGNSAGDLQMLEARRHRGRRRTPGPLRQAAPVPPPGGRAHRLVTAAVRPLGRGRARRRRSSAGSGSSRSRWSPRRPVPIRTTRRGRRRRRSAWPTSRTGWRPRPWASADGRVQQGRAPPRRAPCRRAHEHPGHHGQLLGGPTRCAGPPARMVSRGHRCRAAPRGPPPRRRSRPPRPPVPGAGPGTARRRRARAAGTRRGP